MSSQKSSKSTVVFVWIVSFFAVGAVASSLGGKEQQCVEDYNTVYTSRGTAFDIGVERYCINQEGHYDG